MTDLVRAVVRLQDKKIILDIMIMTGGKKALTTLAKNIMGVLKEIKETEVRL